MDNIVIQMPPPGTRRLFFSGDTVTFRLELRNPLKGRAFLRSNLGNASTKREEIINHVERGDAYSGQDWRDIRMSKKSETVYEITMALVEIGFFEAKCCFVIDDGRFIWPEGDNIHINVEPAEYCCANSIYCAFVRQFGPNKNKAFSTALTNVENEKIEVLDESGYAVIPPSGTFRDLIKELDHIIDDLNCRILQLLPINPTPTVYARMGRYGSPYAALDFTAVDPAYAEFDKKATPLDQFLELVDSVHLKNARIILDIAINHTGWAARIHETHPEWLVREDDGSIHSPGAWGVTWADLTELNHKRLDLWNYLAGMFMVWCSRGVDGFRCDAGYMIPVKAWEYIIARVKREYPNTLFLLEGLGGDPAITLELLNRANMNWAYSELFQNYSREQVQSYIGYSSSVSRSDGLMVHYAETHDNNRLAAESDIYARMRTALCALTSSCGAFGFANGVEWFAREKIDVHEARALNWGAPKNQVAFIARINSILIAHPAFHNDSGIEFIDSGNKSALAFKRISGNGDFPLLILLNLNCSDAGTLKLSANDIPFRCKKVCYDLISGEDICSSCTADRKNGLFILEPGEVLCLSPEKAGLALVNEAEDTNIIRPDRIELQRARAAVLGLFCSKNSSHVMLKKDRIGIMAERLLENPLRCIELIYKNYKELPVVRWRWPYDLKRRVMIPPGHLLFVTASSRFRATVEDGDGFIISRIDSLKDKGGDFFAVFPSFYVPQKHKKLIFKISVYEESLSTRESSELLLLSGSLKDAKTIFSKENITTGKSMAFLAGNGRGGILRPSVCWAQLNSRYDAYLLANLSTEFPEDRHIMWRRCRMWALYHGRSREFSTDMITGFVKMKDGGFWKFKLPAGGGLFVDITVMLKIVERRNAVRMFVYRHLAGNRPHSVRDSKPIGIVIRPDVEDRNFHHATKAFAGPEKHWPGSVSSDGRCMSFKPDTSRELYLKTSRGDFKVKGEWVYSVFQKNEAERGLDANSDLYSPGYFEFDLFPGEHSEILGAVFTPSENDKIDFMREMPPRMNENRMKAGYVPVTDALLDAMKQYVVKRDKFKTVIAGYPWFLDWGRDTLICVRGLVAGGMKKEARDILTQFASFEENGTLPNMIHGSNASNRDTTDAPLWFFTACADYCRLGDEEKSILDSMPDGKRTTRDILVSIAEGYINGTPSGIKVDMDSMLVYSPPHFTWMDTNYPAGTPREGYPVEIQALWCAALDFLYDITGEKRWKDYSEKASESLLKYFWLENKGFLSDCLHATGGVPAANASADDHLRPNQLFAVTLGALKDDYRKKRILSATALLLVPGGIRSLDSINVSFELPVKGKDGAVLNNPSFPYIGIYRGDEDTRRKPAYHNGTVWSWPFPSYCEAYYMIYGNAGLKTARAVLSASSLLLEDGCVGQIPEIMDGDCPHHSRGCDAQAWGVTELYRVWKILN